MNEPMFLPKLTGKYPIMVAARYHDVELAFAMSEEMMSDDEALKCKIIALRNCLLAEHRKLADGPSV